MITRNLDVRHATGCLLMLVFASLAPRAGAITIVDYPIPTARTGAQFMVAGPDGNLWFTEPFARQLAKVTTGGQVTEFAVPAGAIGAGPDGTVWFTEDTSIGHITSAGGTSTFPFAGGATRAIATGPEGNLYVTEQSGKVGRITPQGVLVEFPTATVGGVPFGIVAAPDGALWYAQAGCRICDASSPDTIGRITTSGVVTEFPIPTQRADPFAIVVGPDGNLWFTEAGCDWCDPRFPGSKVGRITPAGVLTEFTTPTPQSAPTGITRGPDGKLWFTEHAVDQVASISVDGTITEYAVPGTNPRPYGIAAGADGNIWFTEQNANRIGKIVLGAGSGVATTPALSVPMLAALCAGLIAVTFARPRRRGCGQARDRQAR